MRCKLANLSICIILLSILGCERMEYFEPQPLTLEYTKVLAHAASGNSSVYRRNTLSGAIYGLNTLDGIEVDIAISKNHGLWLSHDSKVKSLNKNFINVEDYKIAGINDEENNSYYHKLEDVFAYMSASTPHKTISLDVKYPITLFANRTLATVAKKISSLVVEYGLQGKVLVESTSVEFLKKIASLDGAIETYYLCFGNYEKGIANAYQNGLTGISFDYGRDDALLNERVDLTHSLGLKVLVYTINNEEINTVFSRNVDIIETDNLDFFDILEINK